MLLNDLYEDISDRYVNLLCDDLWFLMYNLGVDQAHKPQYKFRFHLFVKNFESFKSLFTQTSTVENPYRYNDFSEKIESFIKLINRNLDRRHPLSSDVQNLRSICYEIDDWRNAGYKGEN